MSDELDAAELQIRLGKCGLVHRVHVEASTGSTNDLAARMAREGAAEGLLVLAEEQTAGRGRLGRRWEAASGESLCFSLVLRPGFDLPIWPRLTTWAAVAVAQALEEVAGAPAMVKWPNDIYFGERKCVGILTETFIDQGRFAVLGIGVNVGQRDFPEEIRDKACSLLQVCGRRLQRADVVCAILQRLHNSYFLLENGFCEIVAEAEVRSFLKGRTVHVEIGGSVLSGVAHSLDSNGGLILIREDGGFERIGSGEVALSPLEFSRRP